MKRLSVTKLRLLFVLFFLVLAIPSITLSINAYKKIKWETIHQYQQTALALSAEIDAQLQAAIEKEELRSDSDYSFLVLEGDPNAKFLQRSTLSEYPINSDLPGIVGYFQVDETGQYSTPLLPINSELEGQYGISPEDKLLRKQVSFNLFKILTQNELVASTNNLNIKQRPPKLSVKTENKNKSSSVQQTSTSDEDLSLLAAATEEELADSEPNIEEPLTITGSRINRTATQEPAAAVTSGFSQLESAEIQNQISKDLGSQQGYAIQNLKKELEVDRAIAESSERMRQKAEQSRAKKISRKEQNYIPQQQIVASPSLAEPEEEQSIEVSLFESELEPFRFRLLQSGHFLAYRQVWRNGNRIFQGAVLSVDDFFNSGIKPAFDRSPLSEFASLSVAFKGSYLKTFQAYQNRARRSSALINGELLASSSLSEPFSSLSLVFHIVDVPSGSGGQFVLLISASLVIALIVGTYALYRLTYKQSQLAQQHQDFISSVSHELKTPITSIKMYGEILKQGWTDKQKREEYYDFIYSEAERLSRLISNILQISSISRNTLDLNIRPAKVELIADNIRSKIDSQIKQSGFDYQINIANSARNESINIDNDALLQIIINLVDNAIKYSKDSTKKQIDLDFKLANKNEISISVRDYGSGISKQEIGKIFDLFYRVGNEMTRESKGTGIGLALVKELASAMNAKVEVKNHNQGVEFSVLFPVKL